MTSYFLDGDHDVISRPTAAACVCRLLASPPSAFDVSSWWIVHLLFCWCKTKTDKERSTSLLRCIDAIPSVNVALKRPAWQSSVFCDTWGCHGAFKATDGSMVTSHWVAPGCAHGLYNTLDYNPWLAIDLGVPIYVDSVGVLSRGENCGEYSVVEWF